MVRHHGTTRNWIAAPSIRFRDLRLVYNKNNKFNKFESRWVTPLHFLTIILFQHPAGRFHSTAQTFMFALLFRSLLCMNERFMAYDSIWKHSMVSMLFALRIFDFIKLETACAWNATESLPNVRQQWNDGTNKTGWTAEHPLRCQCFMSRGAHLYS